MTSRDSERRQMLIDAFKAWINGGSKGTKPRKARIGRKSSRSLQTRIRASKDRIKRKMTNKIHSTRLSRGQNTRNGN